MYKRYASLYFCCAIENTDNELLTLEIIHRYVELLDKYFGSVCELDIIFNFEKVGGPLVRSDSDQSLLKWMLVMGHSPVRSFVPFHRSLIH